MRAPPGSMQQTELFTEIAVPTKQSSPHHWKCSKAHEGLRFAHGFQTSVYIYIYI
jgi:hypothetical protein